MLENGVVVCWLVVLKIMPCKLFLLFLKKRRENKIRKREGDEGREIEILTQYFCRPAYPDGTPVPCDTEFSLFDFDWDHFSPMMEVCCQQTKKRGKKRKKERKKERKKN